MSTPSTPKPGINWQTWLTQIFSIVPGVIAGIEQIHGDAKSGADKKTLAMEALGLANATGKAVISSEAQVIDAATSAVSSAIDNIVSVMNAFKNHGNQPASLPQPPTAQQAQQVVKQG